MKVINIKQTDKDWIASFAIAFFVSYLFYYININSVYSHLDLYWFYFGILLPFSLPISITIKNRLEVNNKC